LGGDGVSLSKANVIQALEGAVKMKEARKYNIINPVISMRNIISYLKDPDTARYPCFGGERVLFVDWFCDAYPCMQLSHALGNILSIGEDDLKLPPCNKCNMSWYRDFSTIFYGVRTLPALIESMVTTGKKL
jgi:MoaA/NifB/PqqE/SkfB family radical SAM enzyme